jgi:long-subunit acyl-CoA synthetase (AMP-forming)
MKPGPSTISLSLGHLTRGEVQIRGLWVASTYYNEERAAEQWHDGWLRTATWA